MTDEQRPGLGDVIKALQMVSLAHCAGCKRPNDGGADWILKTIFKTIPVRAKCPDCQTPEERAECFVEQAIGPQYRMHGIGVVEIPRPDDGSP